MFSIGIICCEARHTLDSRTIVFGASTLVGALFVDGDYSALATDESALSSPSLLIGTCPARLKMSMVEGAAVAGTHYVSAANPPAVPQ